MAKNDDFSNSDKSKIEGISDETYKHVSLVVDSMKAIARLNYQSIYIIDYHKKNFLYVSENPIFLCGCRPEEVKKLGFSFYFTHIPKEEVSMLEELNKACFAFYHQTPIDERLNVSISYDFHILLKDQQKTLINHKLTPIRLADNERLCLVACIVSLSSHQKEGYAEAHIDGRASFWTYS